MYAYVGPAELLATVRPGTGGRAIRTADDFADWMAGRAAEELAEPFTFVVDAAGVLLLAPRRSEHVACAGGAPVLSAGELGFVREAGGSGGWRVDEVTNLSTGYCPDADSWPAVAAALDRVGLRRPEGFTHEVVFRCCGGCRAWNVVREGWFYCVFCDGELS